MNDLVFVDTNVLVYRLDASEPEKQPVAKDWVNFLWTHHLGRLSVQILQEFYYTVTRKLQPGMPSDEAREDLRDLYTWRPLTMSAELLERAFAVEDAYKLSWWDSLIVAAAQQTGCRYLLTEDLQDGRKFEGVSVVDPFRRGPQDLGLDR